MEAIFSHEIRFQNIERQLSSVNFKKQKIEGKNNGIDINKIMNAVDSLFDLGDSNIFAMLKLNGQEQKKYWEIVRKLVKAGIVGYRYYQNNGNLELHFIEMEMVNPKLANAKIKYIDKRQYTRTWVV
ncbi:MAG: hypothetical protein N2517_02535 [Ignavibacteria bacterium]|nr:hypothetical protein [Ignavibacteria bacterium]